MRHQVGLWCQFLAHMVQCVPDGVVECCFAYFLAGEQMVTMGIKLSDFAERAGACEWDG